MRKESLLIWKKLFISSFFLSIFFISCNSAPDSIEIAESNDPNVINQKSKSLPSEVTKIEIINNQIIIEGRNLNSVENAKITASGGFSELFEIEVQEASRLVLNGLRNFDFQVGKVFSLIINDAHATSAYNITFSLQNNSVTEVKILDGAVTARKLHHMGANNGDVLVYDTAQSKWIARPLSGLNLVGTWNANTNTPILSDGGVTTSPNSGDYYVISTAGATTIDGKTGWNTGDWIIYNGTTWDKVVNSSSITSFNGRQGAVLPAANDYSWAQIDKTTSSIHDLSDIDVSGASNGSVLKFDGTNWIAGTDDTAPASNSVGSATIQDGSITNADLAGSIDQSKVTNLTTDLAAKLAQDGSNSMTGNLNMGSNNIISVGTVDGVDVSALETQSNTNTTNISNNATALAAKENSISAGTSAQYFRGDKSWQTLDKAAVGLSNVSDTAQLPLSYLDTDNTLAGDSDTKVPSQKAIKAYVDSAVSGAGSGDFKADGTVAMTGDIDAGNNKLRFKSDNTNYVELKAPNSLAATFLLTLPTTNGTNGQILSTNGSGVLSWISPSTADVAGTVLTGFATGANSTVTNSDTVEVAIEKIQGQIDATNSSVSGKQNSITTGSTAQYLKGDLSLGTLATEVASSTISGFATGANSTITNTDTVETALEKTQGQINATNTAVAAKENTITAGTTAQYFRGDKSWQTLNSSAVGLSNVTNVAQMPLSYLDTDNTLAGDSDVKVPSQKAIKAYVDNAVSGAGSGDFKADGTVAMTGDIDAGNNKLRFKSDNTNYVELKAPNSLTATYLLTFPGNDGTNGQILSTNGSGVLSWISPSTADVAGTVLTGFATGANSTVTNSDTVEVAIEKIQGQINATNSSVSGKQNSITTGTTAQYLKGDLSLGTFATEVASSTISGFATGANSTITNSDTVETALEKVQGQINATNTAVSGKQSSITTGTNAQYLKGDLSLGTFATDVTGTTIINFLTGANTSVDNSDTIETAIEKLQGQVNATNSAVSTNTANISSNASSLIPLTYMDTDNTLSGDSDTKIASQKAVKAYVDAQVSGAGTGDFKADGSVVMTGNLDVGSQSISNAASLALKSKTATALTGTVTVNAASNAVTGTGTAFTTELKVGDTIQIGSETFTVASITDATNLTIDSNHIAGASGVTANKDTQPLNIQSGDAATIMAINGRNVGIGTSAPRNRLAISGPDDKDAGPIINFRGDGLNQTENGRIRFTEANSTYQGTYIHYNGVGNTLNFGIHKTADELIANDENVITIARTNGNVGVGTDNPSEKLEVSGTVKATAFSGDGSALTGISVDPSSNISLNGNASKTFTLERHTTADTAGNNLTVSAGGATSSATDKAGGDLILSSGVSTGTGSSKIEFKTSPAGSTGTTDNTPQTVMTLLGNGNVGIGTSSPASKLEVKQSADNVDSGLIIRQSGGGANTLRFWVDSAGARHITGGDGSGHVLINSVSGKDGNVGIGTVSPTAKLHVNGSILADKITANLNSITVAAAGWYRIAELNGVSGRGECELVITTNGGALAPTTSKVRFFHDYASNASIWVDSSTHANYWTEFRVTGDGTKSYLEANFTQALSSNLNSKMTTSLGMDYCALYSGALPAGGDTVRKTVPNGELVADTAFVVNTSDNVGIGTTTPAEKLHLSSPNGVIIVQDSNSLGTDVSYTGWISGRDSAGTESWWVGEGSIVDKVVTLRASRPGYGVMLSNDSGSLSLADNGNIGIGTTSPEFLLDVAGSTPRVEIDASDDTSAALIIDAGASSDASIGFESNNASTWYVGMDKSDSSKFKIGTGGSIGANESITIDSSGNVGIGTTAPSEKLDVNGTIKAGTGSAANGRLFLAGRYTGDNYFNTFGSQYSSGATVIGFGAKPNSGAAGFVSATGVSTGQKSVLLLDSELEFLNSPNQTDAIGTALTMTSRFKVDASGNTTVGGNLNVSGSVNHSGSVGIGTSSPEESLHVLESGTASVNDVAVFGTSGNSGAGRGTGILLRTPGSASSVKGGRIASYGGVGVNMGFSTSPDYLDTEPLERMTITGAGNVGIGTTAPSEKLEVNGKIKANEICDTTDGTCHNISTLGGDGVPNGAIAAFNGSCPTGWSEFTQARGRAIIGAGSGNTDVNGDALTSRTLGATGGDEATGNDITAISASLTVANNLANSNAPTTASYIAQMNTQSFFVEGFANVDPVLIPGLTVTGGQGTGQAGNMMPFIALTWCEKTTQLSSMMKVKEKIKNIADIQVNDESINFIAKNIGIGTPADPSYALHVNGLIAGTNGYVNLSDKRYKRDIATIKDNKGSALEKINQLDGVYYFWKKEKFPKMKFQEDRDMGVIAQDVQKVFPEAVEKDQAGFLSVAYSKLVAPLIEAVKELYAYTKKAISKLSSEVKKLKAENKKLKDENKMIKEYLCQKDKDAPFCAK